MSEKRYSLQHGTAPAEEVGQSTIDALTKKRLIDRYEVKELKPVSKPAMPAELKEEGEKTPKAKATTKPE